MRTNIQTRKSYTAKASNKQSLYVSAKAIINRGQYTDGFCSCYIELYDTKGCPPKKVVKRLAWNNVKNK